MAIMQYAFCALIIMLMQAYFIVITVRYVLSIVIIMYMQMNSSLRHVSHRLSLAGAVTQALPSLFAIVQNIFCYESNIGHGKNGQHTDGNKVGFRGHLPALHPARISNHCEQSG